METNLEECTRKTVTCPTEEKVWRVWHVTDGVGIHALQADVQKLKLNDMLTL